ncbi:MAG: hypothetical protein ACNA8W_16820, partial [Bradymonadaceae bacterium]
MNDPVVTAAFFEHLDREIGRLERKNRRFEERLGGLEETHGESPHLRDALSSLKRSDEELIGRLRRQDWPVRANQLSELLAQGLMAQGPAATVASEDLDLFWSDEHAEVHLRKPARSAVPKWRQKAFLRLDALIEDVLVPQKSSAAYPIIFSHDIEENHRLIVTAVVGALLELVLLDALEQKVSALKFAFGARREPHLIVEGGEVTRCEFIGADALGFRPERELARMLDDFVIYDSQAHWTAFERRRRERGGGGRERVDLVDRRGRALQIVLE